MLALEQRLNLTGLPPGSRILAAVSGGADSMAMLHALRALVPRRRWQLTVAHLDHGIRGKASREDAAFVRKAARRLGIPCIGGRVSVPSLAKRAGISLEMAARQARYVFLARAARKTGAGCIVTAHTADDQVETFFLKLLRGAGRGALAGIRESVPLAGLVAVKPAGSLMVVRPMLGVTRREVLEYLREAGGEWREDATNADPAYLRNRIRGELLPLLEKDYSPGLRDVVRRMSDVFSAEEAWMDSLARGFLAPCRAGDGQGLDLARLSSYPVAARRRVLRLWLCECGVPDAQVDYEAVARLEAMLGRGAGSESVDLGGGWSVDRAYRELQVRHGLAQQGFRIRLRVPGVTVLPGLGLRIKAVVGTGIVRERGVRVGAYPATATLDAGVWAGRVLFVRSRRPGDRMRPYGMRGTRKLQDILVDAGVPRPGRGRIPLVECGDEIVWIPGYRIAREWAVRGGSARSLKLVLERSAV